MKRDEIFRKASHRDRFRFEATGRFEIRVSKIFDDSFEILRDQHDVVVAFEHEIDHGKNVLKGAKAEDAFPDFIARKGRQIS